MTYVLFFVVGLSGGSAQFASADLCEAAGKQMIAKFSTAYGESGPVIRYFCIESGFRAPQ